jgi:acetyl esterase/lipase
MSKFAILRQVLPALLLLGASSALAQTLDEVWAHPPPEARLKSYWWWLNGNVTKESLTQDLEAMKAKGFGGAVIFDGDGAAQDGNSPVPHGPTFATLEWRELFKHTLHEADRLGLELSLNIQSGWNLGGPMVKPEDAPKKLTWSETRITGGTQFTGKLGEPARRDNFYRDLFVLAYRLKPAASSRQVPPTLSASSAYSNQIAKLAADGAADTFWVSDGTEAGQGPTPAKPQWLQLDFSSAVSAEGLVLSPRDTYGPRDCELQSSDDGKAFRTVKKFIAGVRGETKISFPTAKGRAFRLVITGSFDPKFPRTPRNVQVAEIKLLGENGAVLGVAGVRPPLQNQREKSLLAALRPFSAPDSAPLFAEFPATPGEEDAHVGDVMDLTAKLDQDGTLRWEVPAGEWQVIRFGFTLNDHCRVSTCSEGWEGYALDPFDAGAFRRYWDAVVEPLLQDAGPFAGKTLKYLHTDSWEVEVANWTPTLREEFRQRRGYDLLPWLPVITGSILNSRAESDRFLNDFRRTMGDLAIDNHYRLMRDGAYKHGMLIHPESGGPHAVPIDAQQCLGFNDAPMSEFWASAWRHRVGDENRFFIKQPASAAHTYGHKLVLAEGFTTVGPHWQETLWDNLKPAFDKAICEGLNMLVWCSWVSSPKSMGMPGQQLFAGTHVNANVTWWNKSQPFFDYINRCQAMMQQGLFVADVAYYYGSHVPNFARLKSSDPARILPGYDYDVVTEEVMLNRMSVKNGRLVLPDGMSYRVLVLPERTGISLPVLRKLRELVQAGATVIGPRPTTALSLRDFPHNDEEVARLAAELWDGKAGRGRVIAGKTAREVLQADGVNPDFGFLSTLNSPLPTSVDYIHRQTADADIYFVANRTNQPVRGTATFRVSGKVPELWNPVTGERHVASDYKQVDGRTQVPLAFDPCGSWVVVFRDSASRSPVVAEPNLSETTMTNIVGGWKVSFDPKWGGPNAVEFPELVSWTERLEPGIKYYSGTAIYTKTFDLPAQFTHHASRIILELGNVRELAEVRLNGKSCGITWTPPFRVDVTDAIRAGSNQLEIEVVNFWPNRLIGDAKLPSEKRRTRTNIAKFDQPKGDVNYTTLMPSGLLGPVKLVRVSTSTANGSAHETGNVTLPLWPGRPPGNVSGKPETELPARGDDVRRITDVQQPSITVFPAASTNKPLPAVIICPGGGYGILAIDKEGAEVAEWLNRIGITAVLLTYRVPQNREGAFMDAQRAIRLVRQHAKEWNIDSQRVGMIGFSAGGHLTARLSTGYEQRAYPEVDAADQQSCRPDFAMLIYPAYLVDKQGKLASELVVTPQTPSTFLIHTKDDKTFVKGSVVYDQALKAVGVASEFHLFDTGGHGYGLRPSTNAVCHWPELCQQWVQRTIWKVPGK